MIIDRLGEASPCLEEMLEVLGARLEGGNLVIPMHGTRNTLDGIEVNVQHRYCRFSHGKWRSIVRVNAPSLPEDSP